MEILDTKPGFPDISDHVTHNHVDCHSPESIMLWFHRHTPDLTAIINVQIFLLGASMKGANVELNPFFPDIRSYSIKKEAGQGRDRNLLTIVFEKGEMSRRGDVEVHRFSLQNAAFVEIEAGAYVSARW